MLYLLAMPAELFSVEVHPFALTSVNVWKLVAVGFLYVFVSFIGQSEVLLY
jgi:hypothetical protein